MNANIKKNSEYEVKETCYAKNILFSFGFLLFCTNMIETKRNETKYITSTIVIICIAKRNPNELYLNIRKLNRVNVGRNKSLHSLHDFALFWYCSYAT